MKDRPLKLPVSYPETLFGWLEWLAIVVVLGIISVGILTVLFH
jgi:hypothetical protein